MKDFLADKTGQEMFGGCNWSVFHIWMMPLNQISKFKTYLDDATESSVFHKLRIKKWIIAYVFNHSMLQIFYLLFTAELEIHGQP
jgi:hypothetical protein